MNIHNKNTIGEALSPRIPEEMSLRILSRVTGRIDRSRLIQARIRGYTYGSVGLISVVALIPTIQYIASSAYQSGFASYASLFLSDTSFAFAHIQSISLSLLESVPLMGIAAALSLLIVLSVSLKLAARWTSTLKTIPKHAFA